MSKVMLSPLGRNLTRYEVLQVPDTEQLQGALRMIPRKTITQLAYTLILPPFPIGHVSHGTPSGTRLSGSVQRSMAWIVEGKLITPDDFSYAMHHLDHPVRSAIKAWLDTAKQRYTIGESEAIDFIKERQMTLTPDEIVREALEVGGLKKGWDAEPLFHRKYVTPYGRAFWILADFMEF